MNATVTHQAPVIHEHHERLVSHVDRMPATAELIDKGEPAELAFALDEMCGFLNELLIPHMEAAERALYPELERLFQNRHSMTPMRREHQEIRARIAELDPLRDKAAQGPLGVSQQVKLRRLIYQLYASLKIHLAEETLYGNMVEFGASPEREAALAAAMEHTGTGLF
jgi:iron-sulfur cluster repair protein YtfE (RIC family)